MNSDELTNLMNRATILMNEQAKAGMPGYSNDKEFEKTVLAQLRVCCDRTMSKSAWVMVKGSGGSMRTGNTRFPSTFDFIASWTR